MSTYTDASLIVTPNSKKAGKLYALKGADLDAVRATTATYVGSDGLNKTALANEVRFDYTNGSCPSILVEPQRTNLLTYSEQFDNASWEKIGTTINSNTIVAPDGNLSADGIYPNSGVNFTVPSSGLYTSGTYSCFSKSAEVLSAGTYTFSFFIKKNNLRYIQPRVSTSQILAISTLTFNILDLQNKTIYANDGVSTVKIKDYSNNFVRYEITFNISTSATYYFGFWYWKETSGVTDGTLGYNLWGAQLEAGANATSYIPTVASTVTRNADVISKSGISSLINSQEGVLFCEISALSNDITDRLISLTNGTSTERISIYYSSNASNEIKAIIFVGGAIQCNFSYTGSDITNMAKIALKYKQNDFSLFVNGIKRATDNSGITFPANKLNKLSFDLGLPTITLPFNGNVKKIAVFPTALSDVELSQLTTL